MGSAVKSLLLVLAVAVAVTVISVAPAGAGTPCGQAVINDWFDNGVVEKRFPPHCYREAMDQLPRDVRTYSSAKDDIQRALLAVLRGNGTGGGNKPDDATNAGTTNGTTPSGEPKREVTASSGTAAPTSEEEPSKGIIRSTIEWLGPSDAASVPLPLLILAGIAFLLLAAAGGSFVNRRLQERRLPPPPA